MSFSYKTNDGLTLNFSQYNFFDSWNYEIGGLYIFAKRNSITNNWEFLYIGKTDSFGRRMNEHRNYKWPEAAKLGANAVLATHVQYEFDRVSYEKELIHIYRPILNKCDNPFNPQQLGLGGIFRTNITSSSQLGLLESINHK